MGYAENTNVSIERSQEHIKDTLRRYDADRGQMPTSRMLPVPGEASA